VYKAVRFRADACAAFPLARRVAAFSALLLSRLFRHSRHANEGGQDTENIMTLIELALMLNGIGCLIAAVATLISTIHARRRR
jgi:hypothetical protein